MTAGVLARGPEQLVQNHPPDRDAKHPEAPLVAGAHEHTAEEHGRPCHGECKRPQNRRPSHGGEKEQDEVDECPVDKITDPASVEDLAGTVEDVPFTELDGDVGGAKVGGEDEVVD